MIPGKKTVAAPVVAQATAAVAAPAGNTASRPSTPKGTKPPFLLKYAEKDAEGKIGAFQILTGLFQSETKSGETFYKGTDRNSGVVYVIMPNNFEEKKQA